mmetsp:Transcript_36829/g.88610  ORF Transcript_36829/g.88610 Transcript_36829/m.88610 type:complete len:732 (-) Transcript_36829:7-2202(-)
MPALDSANPAHPPSLLPTPASVPGRHSREDQPIQKVGHRLAFVESHQLLRLLRDPLRGKSEELVHLPAGGGLAELAHAQTGVGVDALDPHRGGSLHGQGGHTGLEYTGLVVGALRIEQFGTRQRNKPDGDLQQPRSLHAELHLRSRANQGDLGVGILLEHVSTLGNLVGGGPLQMLATLAGEAEEGWPGAVLKRSSISPAALIPICWSKHQQIGLGPHLGQHLHRLMGRPILPQANGIMGHDVDHLEPAQGGQPHRPKRIPSELQECRRERNEAAVRGHPVAHRGHGVLAHPPPHVPPLRSLRGEVHRPVPLRERGGGQVRGAPHELGELRSEAVQDLLGGLPGGDGLVAGLPGGQGLLPALGELLGVEPALDLRGEVGVGLLVLGEHSVPLALRGGAGGLLVVSVHLIRNQKIFLRRAGRLLHLLNLLWPQRRPVRASCPLLGRRAEADDSLDLDERRLVGNGLRGLDGLGDSFVVRVPIFHSLYMPTVSLVALVHILTEGQLGCPVNGDVVVVVQHDQPPKLQVPSQAAGLAGDPLLHAPVPTDDVCVVVEQGEVRLVVGPRHVGLGQRHAAGLGDPLAERPGADLHAGGHEVLRVPRGVAPQLAEGLQIVHRHVVAGHVKHGVLESTAMAVGEHEAVPGDPIRVARAVVHHLGPEDVCHRGAPDRCSRMTAGSLLDDVSAHHADGTDAELVVAELGGLAVAVSAGAGALGHGVQYARAGMNRTQKRGP